MNDFYQKFIEQLINTSYLEWVAVILAIFYILFAIKENQWCWPAAFFSTAIYSYLFFDVNLYMESLLNSYYLVMAVYGWNQWQKIQNSSANNQSLPINNKTSAKGSFSTGNISSWTIKTHLVLIFSTFILVYISAYLLNEYTNQDFALIDSFTTWFAILATYMVTKKVLENWIYWIIIDFVSIFLFLSKGYVLTAVLFAAYVVLAIIGWSTWKKHYAQQQAINA